MRGLVPAVVRGADKKATPATHLIDIRGMLQEMDLLARKAERVKRCVVHYAAPNGLLYPFCTYNSGPCYREKIGRKRSIPFEQQPEFLALNGEPELVRLG